MKKRLTNYTNRIIHKLGRENYSLDKEISTYSLLIILSSKAFQVIRGLFIIPFLKTRKGLTFVEGRVKIRHKHLVSFGKSVFLGRGVEINALSKQGVVIGNNVSIHSNTIIDCTGGIRDLGEGIVIGNSVGFSPNCYIQVRGKVIIEDNVIFGPYSRVFSENHNFQNRDLLITEQGESRKGVTIKQGVWVGSNVTILDGVTVGENAILAAQALVTKDVPPYAIVGGVPAKVLKQR